LERDWKEGKADGAADRQSPVGWVALRRFCPTLRVEAPTVVLGSWVSTGLQGSEGQRMGRRAHLHSLGAPVRARPNGFSGGVSIGSGVISGLDDVNTETSHTRQVDRLMG
jgi:hypothetical protein